MWQHFQQLLLATISSMCHTHSRIVHGRRPTWIRLKMDGIKEILGRMATRPIMWRQLHELVLLMVKGCQRCCDVYLYERWCAIGFLKENGEVGLESPLTVSSFLQDFLHGSAWILMILGPIRRFKIAGLPVALLQLEEAYWFYWLDVRRGSHDDQSNNAYCNQVATGFIIMIQ